MNGASRRTIGDCHGCDRGVGMMSDADLMAGYVQIFDAGFPFGVVAVQRWQNQWG